MTWSPTTSPPARTRAGGTSALCWGRPSGATAAPCSCLKGIKCAISPLSSMGTSIQKVRCSRTKLRRCSGGIGACSQTQEPLGEKTTVKPESFIAETEATGPFTSVTSKLMPSVPRQPAA